MSADNIIRLPFRPSAATLSIDLEDICGRMIGAHLMDDGEVGIFVEHEGSAVGGVITFDQVRELRDALTDMLVATATPTPRGAA